MFVSALTISGYVCSPSTLGQLNTFIGTCYSGSGFSGPGTVDYDVVPDIDQQELAIIGQMYTVSYFNNLAQSTMGYGGDSIPYQSLAEGDTKMSRVNAASIGAVYLKSAMDATNNLKYMINVYIQQVQNGDKPRQVLYPNVVFPTWSNGYWGN